MTDPALNDPRPSLAQRPTVFRHSGLLGTFVEVRVALADSTVDRGVTADDCNELVIAEIGRLERIFSAFDPASEFSRWCLGTASSISSELTELMASALDWHHRSDGGFNPLTGELTTRWQQAETENRLPDEHELAAIADRIRQPRYAMIDQTPTPTGDCSAMNLNAIAKGFIVDRALRAAAARLESHAGWWISVNAGGDLAHCGVDLLRVGIENPHRPYDNEPPLVTIALANAALATSGLARRGFRVGSQWYGHVFDPRTGWPVEAIASISVVAPDAATADVVATIAGVLPIDEALAFVDSLEAVDALIIDSIGQRHESRNWQALVVPPKQP